MKKYLASVLVMFMFVGILSPSYAGNKEFCKISGKKVKVENIKLSTDFFPEKKYVIAGAAYTFFLDSNDMRIAMKYLDTYLNRKSNYYVMAGIMLQYINSVYPKTPCPDNKKICRKEVSLSVNNFFDYLNKHSEIKKKYLEASISRTLLAPRYKSLDYFLLQRTREVAHAFYGISYLNSDALLTKSLADKMAISIMEGGNIQEITPQSF